MNFKENTQYKYWNKIRKQCNEFYYFDKNLNYRERQYFYDLKLEAIAEMNKIEYRYGK